MPTDQLAYGVSNRIRAVVHDVKFLSLGLSTFETRYIHLVGALKLGKC
jgi:hypothetical protein